MPKNKLKFAVYLLITVIITLGLSISLQSLLAAWNPPTANPPGNNIDMPINESASDQTKLGGLSIHNNFYVGDGTSNDVLYVDNAGGKVGIGTTNPGGKLHVQGDVNGTSRTNQIYISSATNQNQKLYIGINGNNGAFTGDYGSIEYLQESKHWGNLALQADGGNVGIGTTNPGNNKLEVDPDGVANNGDEFVIDASGNVGIGVNPPTEALHVSGDIKATGDICISGKCLSTVGGSSGVNAGTQGQAAYYQSNGSIVSGTSNLFIDSSGKVGIGVGASSPERDLQVVNGNDGAIKIGKDAGANAEICLNNNCFKGSDLLAAGGCSAPPGGCEMYNDCDHDGYSAFSGDCDESCSTCYIGAPGRKTPDTHDQDCDGAIDESGGFVNVPACAEDQRWIQVTNCTTGAVADCAALCTSGGYTNSKVQKCESHNFCGNSSCYWYGQWFYTRYNCATPSRLFAKCQCEVFD